MKKALKLPTSPALRVCRVCGCMDADCRQCIARTGRPCFWVEGEYPPLCTACDAMIDARVKAAIASVPAASDEWVDLRDMTVGNGPIDEPASIVADVPVFVPASRRSDSGRRSPCPGCCCAPCRCGDRLAR